MKSCLLANEFTQASSFDMTSASVSSEDIFRRRRSFIDDEGGAARMAFYQLERRDSLATAFQFSSSLAMVNSSLPQLGGMGSFGQLPRRDSMANLLLPPLPSVLDEIKSEVEE
jgi:hypothetical protein